MEFLEFVIDEALVLIPVLLILGAFLKGSPKIPDWIIPWVLTVVGIGAAMGILGLSVQSAIQGILVAGAAVLGHQLVKQTTKRD